MSESVIAVAVSSTSAELVAANDRRKELWVHNAAGETVYIRAGGTAATTTLFSVPIPDGYTWQLPTRVNGTVYRGAFQAITAGAGGNVLVSEFT